MRQSGNQESLRAFIAIKVEPVIMSHLTVLQRALQELLPERTVIWTGPEHIHLTLKFLGQIPTADVASMAEGLRGACLRSEAFELDLGSLGGFPSLGSPKIIWVGLNEPTGRLLSLQGMVETEISPLVEHSEDRPFHPHLTVGRVRRAPPRELRKIGRLLQNHRIDPVSAWTVREVHLMQSILSLQGPTYTCLSTVKLKG